MMTIDNYDDDVVDGDHLLQWLIMFYKTLYYLFMAWFGHLTNPFTIQYIRTQIKHK